MSGPNSTLNGFIEVKNYYWDTGTEVPATDLISNCTKDYNRMVPAKEWKNTYPKDSKIIEVTNSLSKLEK